MQTLFYYALFRSLPTYFFTYFPTTLFLSFLFTTSFYLTFFSHLPLACFSLFISLLPRSLSLPFSLSLFTLFSRFSPFILLYSIILKSTLEFYYITESFCGRQKRYISILISANPEAFPVGFQQITNTTINVLWDNTLFSVLRTSINQKQDATPHDQKYICVKR